MVNVNLKVSYRKCTFTRRHCKLLFIQYLLQRLTTLYCGPPHRRLTVMSAKACCGVSQDKELGAQSAVLNVTRNAKIC